MRPKTKGKPVREKAQREHISPYRQRTKIFLKRERENKKWRKLATAVAMVVIGGGPWQAPPN